MNTTTLTTPQSAACVTSSMCLLASQLILFILACAQGTYMYQGSCLSACPLGSLANESLGFGICSPVSQVNLTVSLTSTQNNTVYSLIFNANASTLFKNLSQVSQITVQNLNKSSYSFTFKWPGKMTPSVPAKNKFTVDIEFNFGQVDLQSGNLLTFTFKKNPFFDGMTNYTIENTVLTEKMQEYYLLSSQEQAQINNSVASCNSAGSAAQVTTVAVAVVSSHSSSSFSTVNNFALFNAVRFLNITYPANFREFLKNLEGNPTTLTFLPQFIQDSGSYNISLAYNFEKYDISPFLLENFGAEVLEFVLLWLMSGAVILMKKCFFHHLSPKFRSLADSAYYFFVWNFLISYVSSNYFLAVLYLNLQFTVIDLNDGFEKFNFAMTIIFLLVLGVPLVFAKWSLRYRSMALEEDKRRQKEKQEQETSQEELKTLKSQLQQIVVEKKDNDKVDLSEKVTTYKLENNNNNQKKETKTPMLSKTGTIEEIQVKEIIIITYDKDKLPDGKVNTPEDKTRSAQKKETAYELKDSAIIDVNKAKPAPKKVLTFNEQSTLVQQKSLTNMNDRNGHSQDKDKKPAKKLLPQEIATLVKDFNYDNITQVIFLTISLFRGLIFFTIAVWLVEYPEVILTVWICITSCVAGLFPLFKPYAFLRNNIRWFACEVFNIIIYSMAFAVKVIEKNGDDYNTKIALGSAMLIVNTLLYFWNLVWTLIDLSITVYWAVKGFLDTRREEKEKQKAEKEKKEQEEKEKKEQEEKKKKDEAKTKNQMINPELISPESAIDKSLDILLPNENNSYQRNRFDTSAYTNEIKMLMMTGEISFKDDELDGLDSISTKMVVNITV